MKLDEVDLDFRANLDARLRKPMKPLTHPEVLGKLLPEAVVCPRCQRGEPCQENDRIRAGAIPADALYKHARGKAAERQEVTPNATRI